MWKRIEDGGEDVGKQGMKWRKRQLRIFRESTLLLEHLRTHVEGRGRYLKGEELSNGKNRNERGSFLKFRERLGCTAENRQGIQVRGAHIAYREREENTGKK